MVTDNTSLLIQKSRNYGLKEFLDIVGELSQESTKKGLLTRLEKELITLGLALNKNCNRCITIHNKEAIRLEASDLQLNHVKKVNFFMSALPPTESVLWDDWVHNWKDYSYSKSIERHQLREMVALAISMVIQNKEQIELHLTEALNAGITINQIFEIVPLVMLMDGAPSLSQIPTLLTSYEKYKETNNISE